MGKSHLWITLRLNGPGSLACQAAATQLSCAPADPPESCRWVATVHHSQALTDRLLSYHPAWPLDVECGSHMPRTCENPKVLDIQGTLVLFLYSL